MKRNFNILNLSLLLIFGNFAISQTPTKKNQLQKTVAAYSVDNNDNFYLGFTDGSLTKYDEVGNLLENYALPNKSSITLIDVQNTLRPFLFYFDNQQVVILDRFSSVPKIYHLRDLNIQFGMLACPAPDGDLWIIENNPQRLKKINPQRMVLVLELQMNLGDSLTKMQAYQNLLLISNRKQLIALDQFGGELYRISLPGINSFQIRNQELLVTTERELITLDLLSGSKIHAKSINKGSIAFKLSNSLGVIEENIIKIMPQN
ncbi:MAG: hypothetical protein HRT61_01515 [Ekhidna sp.]|nr:hypothetical protein [Ekhidna sp.]